MNNTKFVQPINEFSAVVGIVSDLFSSLRGHHPSFGLGAEDFPRRGGGVESIDHDEGALLIALNLILVNLGTTDAWLCRSLSTALGREVDQSVATKLNRYLINQDVINTHPTIKRTLYQGRVINAKIWELTEIWMDAAKTAQSQEVLKVAPREVGEVIEMPRVKGESEGSVQSNSVLAKLDSVELQYHRDIASYCKHFMLAIPAQVAARKPTRLAPGQEAPTTKEIIDAKKREARAVYADFENRGFAPFQLTHSQDSRGRIYARGGSISTQASTLQKAGIIFADKAPIDQEELYIYLGRLAKSKGTNAEAMKLGMKEFKNPKSLEAQSIVANPHQAIIRLDGCSNGIQWMSALFNDSTGMLLTNLTGNEPRDLYTYVQNTLEMPGRDDAKSLVMPYSYGASTWSLAQSHDTTERQINLWLDAVDKILPIRKYLDYIESQVEFTPMEKLTWEMPDGFRVVQEYTETDRVKAGRSFVANIRGTERIDKRKMRAALAPNIIHSIDAYHARAIIHECNFPVAPIHDSFGCHSSNVKELRKTIRKTFRQILNEDILNHIVKQMGFDAVERPASYKLITNDYMFM